MVAQPELVEKWVTQVFRPAEEKVRHLLERYPDRRSLIVSYEECGTDYRFTSPLVTEPDRALAAGREALATLADREFDAGATVDPDDRIYLRVTDVPDRIRTDIEALRAGHLNRLVLVEGTVTATDPIRPRFVDAAFGCERCDETTTVPQHGSRLRERAQCPSCRTTGTLRLRPDRSRYVDAQMVTLESDDGERTVPVSLEHDLAGTVAAGEHLEVVAIPRARPDGDATAVDVELEAISTDRGD